MTETEHKNKLLQLPPFAAYCRDCDQHGVCRAPCFAVRQNCDLCALAPAGVCALHAPPVASVRDCEHCGSSPLLPHKSGCPMLEPLDKTIAFDVPKEYRSLLRVLHMAIDQASQGKGKDRHSSDGEHFENQQIVKLGEWLHNTGFQIGQACKKSLESVRLPRDRAIAELLGAINYLAAAVILREKEQG